MSPFAHFLHQLRMKHEIRQCDLAAKLGYEQTYISALEVGIKGPPTTEFVDRLAFVLSLSPTEQVQLQESVAASHRKLVLDSDSPQDIYWMLKDLREQVNTLHPVQIQMIRQALEIRDSLAKREPEQIGRLRRRRREAAAM